MITLIVATDENNGIGIDNKLPWNIPEEMKVFVEYTRGKTVVMGRKTFESIGSKALPKRFNIVCTRVPNKTPTPDTLAFVNMTRENWRQMARSSEEYVVIGGEEIYLLALPWATKIVKSTVSGTYDCDAFFPNFLHGSWSTFNRIRVGPWKNQVYRTGDQFVTELWSREYLGEIQPDLFI